MTIAGEGVCVEDKLKQEIAIVTKLSKENKVLKERLDEYAKTIIKLKDKMISVRKQIRWKTWNET